MLSYQQMSLGTLTVLITDKDLEQGNGAGKKKLPLLDSSRFRCQDIAFSCRLEREAKVALGRNKFLKNTQEKPNFRQEAKKCACTHAHTHTDTQQQQHTGVDSLKGLVLTFKYPTSSVMSLMVYEMIMIPMFTRSVEATSNTLRRSQHSDLHMKI